MHLRCATLTFVLLVNSVIGLAQTSLPATLTPALIGYYSGDGHDLESRRIDQLTHLIWCFGHLEGDSMVVPPSQEKVIRKMVGLKRQHPSLKVLLSLGGWGNCPTCSEVFSREEGRKRFAESARKLLKRTWADGIDLDWEYPAVQGPQGHLFAPEDRRNFTLLVQELRRSLGPKAEVSFAVGGTEACIVKGFEWDSVMVQVDRVHIMSYDLVHGFSRHTGHHTALFPVKEQSLSAARAVQVLDSLQVPRSKVVIGAAFYARFWKQVPAKDNGLFQPGVFSHTRTTSALDTVVTEAKGWRVLRDEKAQAPYAYRSATKEFVTYDDAESVAAKARYVRSEGLGGIMFWQLADDKRKNGLLQAIHDALRAP
ncbi:MAG: glycoside hydrolase [Flavobacteriales bacterium]|nr:glycoside hydrolase [Flavobacteriales bacterium]